MAGPASANGSLLSLGGLGSPQTFTAVAFVGDHGGFGVSSSKIPTENHNDTTGFTTHVLALKEPGEWSGKIFWDPANVTHNGAASTGLLALSKTQALRDWRVSDTRNSASYFFFQARVMSIKFSKPVNGAQTADVTLSINGELFHTSES